MTRRSKNRFDFFTKIRENLFKVDSIKSDSRADFFSTDGK